jgi:hypothetical protein
MTESKVQTGACKSAVMCVCEGQIGLTEKAVKTCNECGHASCYSMFSGGFLRCFCMVFIGRKDGNGRNWDSNGKDMRRKILLVFFVLCLYSLFLFLLCVSFLAFSTTIQEGHEDCERKTSIRERDRKTAMEK